MSSTDADDPPKNVPADSSDGATQEPLEFNGPDPIGEQISPERRIKIPQDAAPKALTRPTYFSFGDNGTTATVNAYGRILQISKFSEHARSGFFCVDLPSMAEPYYVKRRMKNILDLIEEPAAGIGIDWDHTFKETGDAIRDKPTVEFIDDRWPLFVFGPSAASEQSHHDEQPQDHASLTDSQHAPRSSQRVSSGSFKSRLSLQYLCSGGTLFQRSILAREMQGAAAEKSIPTRLKLSSDLLIRDTDFTEKTSFNSTNRESGYTSEQAFHKHDISVTHDLVTHDSSGEIDSRSSVTLIVQPFVDNTLQEVEDDNGTWYIKLGEGSRQTLKSSGILDISIAYTIYAQGSTVQSNSPAIRPLDSKRLCAAFSTLHNSRFERLTFSSHAHLDFTIRRNLEHILSVCSIPATQGLVNDTEQKPAAVALTCGDISGHRVALSASFFAFQFLLFADRHLRGEKSDKCVCEGKRLSTCEAYSCRFRHRIQETCIGHLTWVFVDAETKADRFSLHYWATGKPIKVTTHLPHPSPADTALQILKIFDPSKNQNVYEKWKLDLPESTEKNIRDRIHAWASDLEHGDKRKKYAFARSYADGNQEKFRLADHVRIQSAFRLIQRLRDDDSMPISFDGTDAFVAENLNAEVVRKNILKRFTTKDPVSQQRMLATTRTASTTRFLFHSKDTALFYAMSDGVFTEDRDRKDEDDDWDQHDLRWRRTMDCQGEHEEPRWLIERKPLHFALMVIAGSKGRTLNTLGPQNAIQIATQALLNSSSPNGLFPGLLDGDLEPTTLRKERLRDDYWHATFEIPYVLWRYGKDDLEKKYRNPNRASARSVVSMQSSHNKGTEPGMLRSKTTSFVNLDKYIDRKGFVEITDDWLQKGPKALNFTYKPRFLATRSDTSQQYIDVKQEDLNNIGSVVLYIALWSLQNSPRALPSSDKSVKGVVVDVPRGYGQRKGERLSQGLTTFDDLAKTLGRTRNVNEAKKRLIWLPRGDTSTAALCYLATPPSDRVDTIDFFERHASYDKYFVDEASAFLNEWNTELHISFYCLFKLKSRHDLWHGRGADAFPKFSYVIPKISSWRQIGVNKEQADAAEGIARASMSFRFVGDFFDRYWTGHFLEYIPDDIIKFRMELDESSSQSSSQRQKGLGEKMNLKDRLLAVGCEEVEDTQKDGRKKYPWQQRRVLELLLLHQMLEKAHTHTQEIMDWIQSSILEKPPPETGLSAWQNILDETKSYPLNPLAKALEDSYQTLHKGNGDHYFSIVDRWRIFEQVLRTLEEDLSGNLALLDEWNRREKEREPESPRWTRNDEKTFRPTINKLRTKTQRQARELERLRTRMNEFRGAVTSRLSSIRDERSFRGSENINLFTYVTVVFLPLGFATGIFSMSGSPDRSTLIGMIELAFIALALTIFALANAQTSGRAVVRPMVLLFRGINNLFFYPLSWLSSPVITLLSEWGGWFSYVQLRMQKMAAFYYFRLVKIPLIKGLDQKTGKIGTFQRWKRKLLPDITPPTYDIISVMEFDPLTHAVMDYASCHETTQLGRRGEDDEEVEGEEEEEEIAEHDHLRPETHSDSGDPSDFGQSIDLERGN